MAAQELRGGLKQIFFVTKSRFTKQESDVFNVLKTVLFDKNVAKYTAIIKTNAPFFRNDEKCREDREILENEKSSAEIVKSVAKIIHVDNPPLEEGDPNGENDVAIKKRNASRKILLNYLGNIKGQNYRPKNLDELDERINRYLEENDVEYQGKLKEWYEKTLPEEIKKLEEKMKNDKTAEEREETSRSLVMVMTKKPNFTRKIYF